MVKPAHRAAAARRAHDFGAFSQAFSSGPLNTNTSFFLKCPHGLFHFPEMGSMITNRN